VILGGVWSLSIPFSGIRRRTRWGKRSHRDCEKSFGGPVIPLMGVDKGFWAEEGCPAGEDVLPVMVRGQRGPPGREFLQGFVRDLLVFLPFY
jgi:hypothetical protein